MSGAGRQADPRSRIPGINALADRLMARLPATAPRSLAVRLARTLAADMRARHLATLDEARVDDLLRPLLWPGPRPVINATGILLHTNLGRAPLAPAVTAAAMAAVSGYTDLELDPGSGKRGHRDRHFAQLARLVWDAPDATLVNNGAAAVCLALAALGAGRETIVSRGELIEIGGSFRLPDIMSVAGTRLREVGTTNKTRLPDYATAIGSETGCLFKSHTSNYRIEGFTHSVSLKDLADLGRSRGVPVVMDLGSGLTRWFPLPVKEEDRVEDCLAAGPDLLIFSGDKLFGGVQAGLILGEPTVVARLRKHPMMRAVRCDKLTISLICHQLQHLATDGGHPLAAMGDEASQRERALALVAELEDDQQRLAVEPDLCFAGGGSLPGEALPAVAIAVGGHGIEALAARLRAHDPPVFGHIREGRLYLNLAAVPADLDAVLGQALRACL